MSDNILKALAAAGGHAHISTLAGTTNLPIESVKNYLELLKKDNKVVFHNSAWHLKIFSNKPPIKRQHISEKILECLADKRTLLDLQCMLPEVKQVQLKETLESLEKQGKIKSMVCYKAIQKHWNTKPTNPVQPILNKPPPHQERAPRSVDVEPVFTCQDIRYMDKDNSNNRSNSNENRPQNFCRDKPKSGPQQQPPSRHLNDNSRYPPPQNTGFNSTPFSQNTGFNSTPFAPNGARAVRVPCSDTPPARPPPQTFPPQHSTAPSGPLQNHPGAFNSASPRGAAPARGSHPRGPPPQHVYRPPVQRPPIRLTGIDPYTNKAYGCSDTGYTAGPPNAISRPMFTRQDVVVPLVRGHELSIRNPAPVGNSTINRPDQSKRRQGAGRGKSAGRGRSRDMDYVYSKERKNLACTQKDPAEEEVKAAMKKDSESKEPGMGSWDDVSTGESISKEKRQEEEKKKKKKKVLKKPPVSNTHVLIDSDEGSDDISLLDLPSLPSIPSNLDNIIIDDKSGNFVPLGSGSPISDLPQSTVSSVPASRTESALLDSEPSESEQQKLSSADTNIQNPASPVHLSENNPSVLDPYVSRSSHLTPSISDPTQGEHILTAQSQISTTSPSIPTVHDSPDIHLELQQISSKLSSYNFGIQSDDSDDDEEDDKDGEQQKEETKSEVSSKTPTHLTSNLSRSNQNKMHVGAILKPVSQLCSIEGLSPPVLLIKHRPEDLISPWCCEITVDQFSGVGEGDSQREAAQLAVGRIRTALTSNIGSRKFRQQTDFYAEMLHYMCGLRGFFPPVYRLVIKPNQVKIEVTLHGDQLFKTTSTERADGVLVKSFKACCEELLVPVPGISAWKQEQYDYKMCLLSQFPGTVVSSRKVQESWWGEVNVQGVNYEAPTEFPKKWLSEQAAACVACFALKLPIFNWDTPYVYIGKNTTFRRS